MKLTYEYECVVCHGTATQTWSFGVGEQIPKPSLPAGWRQVLGQIVCVQHRVIADLRLEDKSGEHGELWQLGIEL